MYRASIVVALLLGLVALFHSETLAAPQWYNGTIVMAGPYTEGDVYEMRFLIDFGSKRVWTRAVAGRQKEMLSVALTAISNGRQVSVYVDLDLQLDVIPVKGMYIIPGE